MSRTAEKNETGGEKKETIAKKQAGEESGKKTGCSEEKRQQHQTAEKERNV